MTTSSFFNTLETYLYTFNDQLLLVGGDLNTVINHNLDKLNGRSDTNKRTSEKVNELIQTSDLCDVFRLLNPERKLFTWHSNTDLLGSDHPAVHPYITNKEYQASHLQG